MKPAISVILLLLIFRVSSGQGTSIVIPLKSEKCKLTLKYFTASIAIKTGVGKEIKIIASGNSFRISDALQVLDVAYRGNDILIEEKSDGDKPLTEVTFTIIIPKTISILIRADFSPNIAVESTTEDIDIRTLDGNITLTNITANVEARTFKGNIAINNLSGAAQVFTDYGDIAVSIDNASEQYPITLRNLYGTTELLLKKNIKASFRVRKERGRLETNTDMQLLDMKNFPLSEDESSSSHKSIYLSVNGGGIPFYLTTVTGKIIINTKP